MTLTLFCELGMPQSCDDTAWLSTLANRLCTAECNWDEVKNVPCGTLPPFDGLWGECDVPPEAIVMEQCVDGITLWGFDSEGDWTVIMGATEREVVTVPCAMPTVQWESAYGPFGPPSGAILIQDCSPARLVWTWNGVSFELLNSTNAKIVFGGFLAGDFFVLGTSYVAIPSLSFTPVTIPASPCPNWQVVVRVQGYHYWTGCEGVIGVHLNGVLVGHEIRLTLQNANVIPLGVPEILIPASQNTNLGTLTVRLRGVASCMSGATVGVNSMRAVVYLYPTC